MNLKLYFILLAILALNLNSYSVESHKIRLSGKRPFFSLRSDLFIFDSLNSNYPNTKVITPQNNPKIFSSKQILLGLIYSYVAVNTLSSAFVNPILTKLWSLNSAQIGYLNSSWFLGGLIGYALTGLINKKNYYGYVIVGSSILQNAFSTLLILGSRSIAHAIIWRLSCSASAAICFNTIFLYLYSEYENRHFLTLYNQVLSIYWNSSIILYAAITYLLR